MDKITTPDLSELTGEKMDFLQERFEELMEQLIKDRESLHKKAGFLFALLGGVISFCVGKLTAMQFLGNGFLAGFLIVEAIILALCAAYLAWRCLLPTEYDALGGEPRHWLNKQAWTQTRTKMQYAYATLLQTRIDRNRLQNLQVANRIRGVAVLSVLSPMPSAIISALILSLSC